MKLTRMVWSVSLAGLLLLGVMPAKAGTVAYWRFEQGPADAPVAHLSGTDGVWSADVPDSSGNGNALSAWNSTWAGFSYKTDVPYAVVPGTGEANNFSVKNNAGAPAMWNTSLAGWTPSAWTIEAAFKPESGGYRTIVGRDSQGAVSSNAALAALYFQITDNSSVAIKYADVSGVWHEAVSAPGTIQGFNYGSDPNGLTGTWYSMAAVSDGTMLSLYLNNLKANTGYQLVAQTDMSLSGSANTALTPGLGSAGDWQHGNFSVGRGLYNGGHTDRAYGFIDEVRLSDSALRPEQFISVPEPGSLALLILGGLPLLRLRKRA